MEEEPELSKNQDLLIIGQPALITADKEKQTLP